MCLEGTPPTIYCSYNSSAIYLVHGERISRQVFTKKKTDFSQLSYKCVVIPSLHYRLHTTRTEGYGLCSWSSTTHLLTSNFRNTETVEIADCNLIERLFSRKLKPLLGEMGDDQAWPEVPGLDDWYDNAIKAGQGFKSDKEREDYIKSIGDPMMHPLFAECTEDLVGNPLAEGLRLLREEDKTPIEIAIMYKDEGNEWLKKGDKKSLNEAYDRYSHALSILDRTVSAAVSGASSFNAATGVTSPSNAMSPNESIVPSLYPLEVTQRKDEEKDLTNDEKRKADAEENLLRSQILSNRALVSLTLLNHGSCIRDTEAALKCWSGNVKAHYRKCKSLGAYI